MKGEDKNKRKSKLAKVSESAWCIKSELKARHGMYCKHFEEVNVLEMYCIYYVVAKQLLLYGGFIDLYIKLSRVFRLNLKYLLRVCSCRFYKIYRTLYFYNVGEIWINKIEFFDCFNAIFFCPTETRAAIAINNHNNA